MKINIIYRLCEESLNKKDFRPDWFSKIKCLETFYNAVENAKENGVNVVIYFVFDGDKGELNDKINDIFNDAVIKYVNYKDNEKSLVECYKLADTLKGNIYFVEDDYLHKPESITKIVQVLDDYHLVTGYDHLDRYTRTDDVTLGRDYILFSKETNLHWRSTESTCLTFAVTYEAWRKKVGVQAKIHKLNDRQFFRALINDGVRLWSPIPALCTQVDTAMSPAVDWEVIA